MSVIRCFARAVTLASALFACTAFAQDAAQAPQKGGTLVASIFPEPTSLVTAVQSQFANNVVSANIFDGLVRYDQNGDPVPSLATAWTMSDDGKAITFQLRKDVKWHDGAPFTAKDVKFSLLEAWKKLHTRGRVSFAGVTGVDTPDDHTVVVHLNAPSPLFLRSLDAAESAVLPEHVYGGSPLATNPANNKPVGTGPFRFVSWTKGDAITLERNPDYWEAGKPYLDRVIFRYIPDEGGRSAALETGEVVYAPYDQVAFSDVERLKAVPGLKIETRGYDWSAQFQLLEFNLRNPVLKDIRVRQAISAAVNRQGLVDTILYGFGRLSQSPVPSVSDYFVPQKLEAFDPARADKLLDEAGYPRGADGIRFRLRLDRQARPVYLLSSEYIRQNLKRVGIEVEVIARDNPSYQKAVYGEYDFDLNNVIVSAYREPQGGLFRMYWSKNAKPGVPFVIASGYESPEMDKVIETVSSELDIARRKEFFAQLQEIAVRDLPLLPLYEVIHFSIYNERVHGLSTTPDGVTNSLKNVWLSPK